MRSVDSGCICENKLFDVIYGVMALSPRYGKGPVRYQSWKPRASVNDGAIGAQKHPKLRLPPPESATSQAAVEAKAGQGCGKMP